MSDETLKRTKWSDFAESPLALFACIFSLLEAVVLIYFVGVKETLEAIDGANIVLMTVALFALIVVGRPQALYPPERWKDLPRSEEAKPAPKIIALFIFILGGAFAVNINETMFIKIFGK